MYTQSFKIRYKTQIYTLFCIQAQIREIFKACHTLSNIT